jgi:hypothetical protein
MKYKCLRDFWMHRESEENGDIPAFKADDVYEFFGSECEVHRTSAPQLYTPKNNQNSCHYMDNDAEFSEYFELVEEE